MIDEKEEICLAQCCNIYKLNGATEPTGVNAIKANIQLEGKMYNITCLVIQKDRKFVNK
jgi:hypothetical protein